MWTVWIVAAAAWGPTGHRAVAEIAQQQVRPRTARRLRALMGEETLAIASTWPDWIRSESSDYDTWHYCSIPDGTTVAAWLPHREAPDVLSAITAAEAAVADRELPRKDRVRAVRWLVHLVGDVHQPLHVGRSEDRGGTKVDVQWMGMPTNLHVVWDEAMIDHDRWSYTELADVLQRMPVQPGWRADPPEVWAQESLDLRPLVYDIGDGALSWGYRYKALPVVKRRLLQAGLRLAERLDRALR